MKDITTIGIDTAKNYIQIHGENSQGKRVLKKRLSRANFLPFMVNLPKCLIGMEACGGSNYWARKLTELGFEVKLMSPFKVKKFVENNKNDEKDAEACAEAVRRGNMTFVPIKTPVQQEIQATHRIRSFYVKQQVRLSNMIRGLLLEVGIAIPKGKAALMEKLRSLLTEENTSLSPRTKAEFQGLYNDLKRLYETVEVHKSTLEKLAEEDEHCSRIMTVAGVGPITATAMVAKIGNGSEFKKGRDLSAFLGLVPKQNSSGEKVRLGGISKHGDRNLRQLLIHGGRSCLKAAMKKNKQSGAYEKQDEHSQWARKLAERVGRNKTSVAIANKNARIILGILKSGSYFQPALAH